VGEALPRPLREQGYTQELQGQPLAAPTLQRDDARGAQPKRMYLSALSSQFAIPPRAKEGAGRRRTHDPRDRRSRPARQEPYQDCGAYDVTSRDRRRVQRRLVRRLEQPGDQVSLRAASTAMVAIFSEPYLSHPCDLPPPRRARGRHPAAASALIRRPARSLSSRRYSRSLGSLNNSDNRMLPCPR
jgi:hypothetical protein